MRPPVKTITVTASLQNLWTAVFFLCTPFAYSLSGTIPWDSGGDSMKGLLKLGLTLYFLGATVSLAFESHQGSQDFSTEKHRPELDKSLEATVNDLETFLKLLDQRENALQEANESLLREAQYSYVKITAFMLKAAIDGYYATGLVKNITETGAHALTQKTVGVWIKEGGIKRLKSLGFDVGLLGLSGATSSALTETYRWQYSIPILGTAYAAYVWSDKLMGASEIIRQNGNEILRIRQEKFRVRQALEKID